MRTNRLTARVAAKSLQQQVATVNRSDDLAAQSDRIISQAWAAILSILRKYEAPFASGSAEIQIRKILDALDLKLKSLFDTELTATVHYSHHRTANSLIDQLPGQMLHVAATESRLTEDDEPKPPEPGVVRLGVSPIGTLAVRNMAAPLLNPAISKDAKKELAKTLIFPPPSAQRARELVYRGKWFDRLSRMTKLAAPEDVGKVLRIGTLAGKSMRDIARDLMPVLNGVQSSARRIARNEVSRVAHDAQWDAWQEVKDVIIGYQVHAVDNGHHPTSRPEHKRRHLTIYYKLPKRGQKGMNEMPRPPQEADGSTAENCRCWLTVVFGPMPPLLKDIAPHPIDPDIAAPWFAKASVRDKKAAVGADRYAAVRQTLLQQGSERKPQWFDFIDIATGLLLPVDSIAARLLVGAGRRLLQK